MRQSTHAAYEFTYAYIRQFTDAHKHFYFKQYNGTASLEVDLV